MKVLLVYLKDKELVYLGNGFLQYEESKRGFGHWYYEGDYQIDLLAKQVNLFGERTIAKDLVVIHGKQIVGVTEREFEVSTIVYRDRLGNSITLKIVSE